MEQYNIFDYLDTNNVVNIVPIERNYIEGLVAGLITWDKRWGYGYLEEFKKEGTVKALFNTFCKGTNTHFFKFGGNMYWTDGEDVYGARFDKKEGTIDIYKTGKDSEKILATESIEKLVEELRKED